MAAPQFNLTVRVDVTDDMTQNDIVLEHLKEFETITPLEGLSKYGIGNVQGRIADLRLRGHEIATFQDDPNDWATYRLIKAKSDT